MNEETLFTVALEICDPAARAEFLDRACAGDAAVRARLERLLAQHERAGSFLAQPAAAPAETWTLAAISGGHPVVLAGEWDGTELLPLAAIVDGRYEPLAR